MRLRQSRIKQLHHKKKIITKNAEGGDIVGYGSASQLKGYEWPAGGKIQAEKYGQRLSYIKNCRVEGEYKTDIDDKGNLLYIFDSFTLQEDDGICIYRSPDQEPDYRIVAIIPYTPLKMEIEKL